MNIEELRNLAKKMGGVVVINGNTAEFVILTYENYKKLEGQKSETSGSRQISQLPDEGQLIERLNREILGLKEEIKQREEAEIVKENSNGDENDEIKEEFVESVPEAGQEGGEKGDF